MNETKLIHGKSIIIIIIIIITILWNQQIQTDRTIPNNKPDIIIRDNEREHVC